MDTASQTAEQGTRASLRVERQPRLLRLVAAGDWTVRDSARLDAELRGLDFGDAPEAEIDGSAITRMDSSGAWLLVRTHQALADAGKRVRDMALPTGYAPLIQTIAQEHNQPAVIMHVR